MKFTGQIIGALRKGNNLKSRYERLRERGMLDVNEMAALLGTCMRTIYIWHRARADFAHTNTMTREPISTSLRKQTLRCSALIANIAEANAQDQMYTRTNIEVQYEA